MRSAERAIQLTTVLVCAACGGGANLPPAAQTTPAPVVATAQPPAPPPMKEAPPTSAPAREIHFPPIERTSAASGLEINTVALHGVPVVQIKLVIKAGSAADPADLPGTAQLVAEMLKEGTEKRTSAKIAEAVDFLGARLSIHSDEEQTSIDMQALADQLPDALALVAELATTPTFDDGELKKLKKRELDRLSLINQSPNFLARREFWKTLYGPHPYSHVDTTKDVVKRIKRTDLAAFHKRFFAPNNAFLVVVGDVSNQSVIENANKAFKGWTARTVAPLDYPAPPARASREIVLVDRPESVQSVIYVGNLALARKDPEYVPLLVANQVLGGSAASRMFMDLREKQSLTYGAYSNLEEGLVPMPFRAFAAVRNEVTAQAMKGFMDHLNRISSEAAPVNELNDAKRLLVDSFTLHIETPGAIAGLVAELRTYGFPDNYWDGYRSEIQAVTPDAALTAAQKYIKPNQALIVVVGKAAAVKEALSAYGPVKVIDTEGKLLVQDPSSNPSSSGPPNAPAPSPPTGP
ncbi:MAG TPA: pitrilysin family protein, partial [Polyangiales bacterium]|nr:pitrilysin family protein [Polyangiales bacterium]